MKTYLKPIVIATSILMMGGVQAVNTVLDEVTVTGAREETKKSDSMLSIGVISRDAVDFTKPGHPSEIISQVPGAAVAVTNGEGHTTAIRQGFTTSPLYLFLEDGVPIRATGSFNHNALYEVNIPSSGGVEVVRGIGSALYGSDAIGGMVNVLTKKPSLKEGGDASLEFGGHGYRRLLLGHDTGLSAMGSAFRADINLTHTDGWRDKTAYDRQSVNLRLDSGLDQFTVVKTILGYTNIDQETGANSALPYDLYMNAPKTNLRSIGYRKVEAFRLSSEFQKDLNAGNQLSIIPYLRNNKMDLNGTFNLASDARIEKTETTSYGLLIKHKNNFHDSWKSRLITGVDFDYSPGSRVENPISTVTTGSGAYTNYTGYTINSQTAYNYDVTYQNLAPYLQLESNPSSQLKTIFGLRYDNSSYEMVNNQAPGYTSITTRVNTTPSTRHYYSPANAIATFDRLSPKLGFIYQLTNTQIFYGSYNQGFRTPSESQIFRGGRGATQAEAKAQFDASSNLKPIVADQYELGTRGNAYGWNYELVGYQLTKRNDLLGRRDETGATVQTNNGTTRHRGIELALGKELVSNLRFDTALSYAKHQYLDWVTTSSNRTENYSGKEIEASPRWLSNTRLTYIESKKRQSQFEWVRVGDYYLDPSNMGGKYSGHNLFNLRHSESIDQNLSVIIRVMNIFDKRYADSASWSSSNGAVYSPGLPRTFYLGLSGRF